VISEIGRVREEWGLGIGVDGSSRRSNVPTRRIIPPGNLRTYPELHIAIHISLEIAKNIVRNPLVLIFCYENECIQRNAKFLSGGKETFELGSTK